jgi:hypothetical protein
MKRWTAWAASTLLAFVLIAGGAFASSQGTFKITFPFKAGSQKLPSGEYVVSQKTEGQITLQQVSTGKEYSVAVLKRLEKPTPPVGEPQLAFHAVGNFEPSYTEYMTEYLLAEVWLPGEEGYLLLVTKGAHQRQIVKGK